MAANAPLLSVRDLSIEFRGKRSLRAVSDVSFDVQVGETLAVVGESGCGKSITARAIVRLLPSNASTKGSISLAGRELLTLPEREMEDVRGSQIGFIFQDPFTALNPLMTVGQQLMDVQRRHLGLDRVAARQGAIELLERVRIPQAQRRVDDYPHQMSGGMRQRAAIAIAIAARPKLLIADEPTTALDVTIQGQLLQLLHTLQKSMDMGLLLITHDLGVVAETADRVAVMYAGTKVEEQSVWHMFDHPRHPYTRALIDARPRIGERRTFLNEIPGMVPSLADMPSGCAFADRCTYAQPACRTSRPLPNAFPDGSVACLRQAEFSPGAAAPTA